MQRLTCSDQDAKSRACAPAKGARRQHTHHHHLHPFWHAATNMPWPAHAHLPVGLVHGKFTVSIGVTIAVTAGMQQSECHGLLVCTCQWGPNMGDSPSAATTPSHPACNIRKCNELLVRTCQWGSNTGSAASQPAVAFCWPWLPQPYCGSTVKSQLAPLTEDSGEPVASPWAATMEPAPTLPRCLHSGVEDGEGTVI